MQIYVFIWIHIFWILWNFSYMWLHPFCVVAFQLTLDTSNFSAWQISGEPRVVYNYADRGTDLAYYVASLFYSIYFVRELWYLKWVIPFAFYRIIGNIIYLSTLNELFLAIFPNIFGPLFLVYTLLDLLKLDHYIKIRFVWNVILVVVISGIKIAAEIYLHVISKKDEIERDPDFPDVWSRTALRLDCLVWLLFFVLYVGLTVFPSFEKGEVKRTAAYMFSKIPKVKSSSKKKKERET